MSDMSDSNESWQIHQREQATERASYERELISRLRQQSIDNANTINALRETIERLTKERDDLAKWKESALTVEAWWQRIDDFIRSHKDAPMGVSIADTALKFLQDRDAAIARAERLRARLRAL